MREGAHVGVLQVAQLRRREERGHGHRDRAKGRRRAAAAAAATSIRGGDPEQVPVAPLGAATPNAAVMVGRHGGGGELRRWKAEEQRRRSGDDCRQGSRLLLPGCPRPCCWRAHARLQLLLHEPQLLPAVRPIVPPCAAATQRLGAAAHGMLQR